MALGMSLEVFNDASDTQLIIKARGFFIFIVYVTLSSPWFRQQGTSLSKLHFSNESSLCSTLFTDQQR